MDIQGDCPLETASVCSTPGLRVQGLGFRDWGFGFRVQGLGFRDWGLRFRV